MDVQSFNAELTENAIGELKALVEQTAPLDAVQLAVKLREIAAHLDARAAPARGATTEPLDQWPGRLMKSCAVLCRTGLEIQAVLIDQARFAALTDASRTALPSEISDFNRLLVTALTALIDLTGYDNPEQEYPDLETWFEFRCPNVVFGRHTDTHSGSGSS